ncbi:MAG: peptidylprolyl isomerase [Planctomycetota bacterium]
MFRTVLLAPLALVATLSPSQLVAQTPNPLQPLPGQGPAPTPAAPVKEMTPAEKIEMLKKQVASLKREIEYTNDRKQDAASRMAKKLTRAKPSFRAIDAGKPANARPQPTAQPVRRFATLGSAEQMTVGDERFMILANGQGISQSQYDAVYSYLNTTNTSGTEAMRSQRALYDMIRIAAVAGEFTEQFEELGIDAKYAALMDGSKSIEQAARESGSVDGADESGAITITRNCTLGPSFERVAFTTKKGKMSGPIRTTNGVAVLRVDEFVKGAQPQLDKVECHVVEFKYAADAAVLQKALFNVNTGQIQLLVRDNKVMEMLPSMYRKPAPRPSARQQLTTQVSQLTAHLETLKKQAAEGDVAQTDATIADQIKAVEKQLEMLKLRIQQLPAEASDTDKGAAGQAVRKLDTSKGNNALIPVKKGGN